MGRFGRSVFGWTRSSTLFRKICARSSREKALPEIRLRGWFANFWRRAISVAGFKRRSVERGIVVTPLPGPSIPLAEAGLCLDCLCIFNMRENGGRCSKCAAEIGIASVRISGEPASRSFNEEISMVIQKSREAERGR